MITPEAIIARLESLEVDHALAAMRKPQGKDAFDYGFASGRVRGIGTAVDEIMKMLADHERVQTLKESKL